MPSTKEQILSYQDHVAFREICGSNDSHLELARKLLQLEITARGNTLQLSGAPYDVDIAAKVFDQLYDIAKTGQAIFKEDIKAGIRVLSEGSNQELSKVFTSALHIPTAKKTIAAKNLSQKQYVDAISRHPLTFGVGVAGTGKTYLAMAMAVSALLSHKVERIILTRPAVEAGEKLGFLPGDMTEKVNPYLRPLYDALYEMLGPQKVDQLQAENIIEVAPLAFMRGRTLSRAFVILDEAQNTTKEQMRMFLTRLGPETKTVVTGDITQTDLPSRQRSGLIHASHILRGIPDIAMVEFSAKDVVRHPLVQKIILAYEKDDEKQMEQEESQRKAVEKEAGEEAHA